MPPPVDVVAMSKRFGALQALDRVSISLPSGAFHALLGENGAGKSTLVKCLMGYHQADSGTVAVGGASVTIASPRDAHALGLGMVYQHFTLVPSMTVAENLAVVRSDLSLIVNWRAERDRIEAFLDQAPFRLDSERVVSDLAAGERQKLEILKQLYLDRRILILDEPTSVLTPGEADEVLTLLKQLCDGGRLSVLFITHKLREVFAFASTVSVLRRGKLVGEGRIDALDATELARLMIGDQRLTAPGDIADRGSGATGAERLRVEGLAALDDRGRQAVRAVSLSVRAGEIVGLAGVSGNGQRELIQVLAGQRAKSSGRVFVDGAAFQPGRRQRGAHRVAVIPEEPRRTACAAGMTVAENLALDRFDRPPLSGRFGWLRKAEIRDFARRLIDQFSIRCSGPDALAQELSGGNIQRLVLARTFTEHPDVIVMANPCVGLDVAAVAEIHGRIVAASRAGAAVLIASEDLDELLSFAKRILVMFDGQIVLETAANDEARQVIGKAMAGVA
jgi:simple sugar transport system ATP-binding protein